MTASQKQQPPIVPTCPPDVDVESQPGEPAPAQAQAGDGFGVAGILRRWRINDFMKKGTLVLRGLSLLFSLLAFIIMASNKHGDWKNFDKYEEYRYLVGIAILASVYSGVMAFKYVTGKEIFECRTAALVDYIGDQIMAYLLLSSSSSAIPMTDRMRESQDNIFTDSTACAISMAFFAFLTFALLASSSFHKYYSQSYI